MARQIEAISRLRWQTEASREFSGDFAEARAIVVNGRAMSWKSLDNHMERKWTTLCVCVCVCVRVCVCVCVTIESVCVLRVWRKGSALAGQSRNRKLATLDKEPITF